MINHIVNTGEVVIYDDDGYRYRVFIDEDTGPQIVYEEYIEKDGYVFRDRVGLPFVESVDAMILALQSVSDIMKKAK